MNIPYISLTLARQYVTELVRSPRAAASLGANNAAPPSESPLERPSASDAGTLSRPLA